MDRSLILRNLATPYDVMDNMDGTVSKVFVIDSDELYEMMNTFSLSSTKSSKSIKKNPYDVTWYCSQEKEYLIENAVAQAKMDGNDIVVVELIDNDTA